MDVVRITIPSDPTPEQLDALNKAMSEWQDAMVLEQKEIAVSLGVSENTAAAIQYLRTRSRHTAEKELYLIARDKEGNPIHLGEVLSGEF